MRGAVHIVLIHDEHLAKVVGLARLSQDLTLEITQRGKVPACPAAILVLYTRYRKLLHRREDLFHFLVAGLLLQVLLCPSCHCGEDKYKDGD